MYLQKAWAAGHVTLHTQRVADRTTPEALTVQKVTEQMNTNLMWASNRFTEFKQDTSSTSWHRQRFYAKSSPGVMYTWNIKN